MPSRTKQTEQRYTQRVNQLLARYRKDTGLKPAADSDRFLNWLVARRNSVTPSTWRQYRAALAWACDQRKDSRLADRVRQIDTSGCRSRTSAPAGKRNTSARTQKRLPPKDRRALHAALDESTSRVASSVRLMLEACRMTGLRPVEWQTARLENRADGDPVLIVKNAKHTHDRGHGEFRTLHLAGLRVREVGIIHNMVRLARYQGERNRWDQFYHQCRNLLSRYTKRLWPNRAQRPTFYSARHQFVADAKAAGLSRAEVAALMGHASDRTAGERHGRKRNGEAGFRVRPDATEVTRIRKTAKTRPVSRPKRTRRHHATRPSL